jgi:ATP-binding cassette subfamily B protein
VVAAIVFEIAYWTLVPLGLRGLIDTALTSRDTSLVLGTLALMAVGFVLMAIASTTRSALTARLGARLLTDKRLSLLEHLQYLPPRFFGSARTGDLAGRFVTELNMIETALTLSLVEVVWGSLQLAVNVPLLYLLNLQLAVVATVAVPLAMLGPRVLAPRVAATSYLRRQEEGRLLAAVHEQIAGRAVVRAFGLELFMRERFQAELARLRSVTAREGFQARLVGRSTTIGSALGQLIVFATGSILVFQGELTVGTFVGFIGLLLNVGEGVRWLGFGLPTWLQAAGPMRRIGELLEEPTERDDRSAAELPGRLQGRIEIQGVSFVYEGEGGVRDVSLSIPAGAHVAIVGPSGSGKSTLLSLLLRTYEPQVGSILVDGHNLRRVAPAALRRQIGMVFQDSFLFAGSVRDNIRLGKLDASAAELEDAARAAQIHDVIARLPNGYDTDVGEGGDVLSGGQRQRLALARAVLRDPAVLLLDEATSALDPATEAEFTTALRRVASNRTVISVTHRLSTVLDADQIFVLADGRVVERGRHVDLVQQDNGVYAHLWASQAGLHIADDGLHAEVSPERLRQLPLLADVNESLLVRLASQFASERVAPGRVIIAEGDVGDRFYLIARGTADVIQIDPDGTEHVVRVLEDGDHFGELALLGEGVRSASVRAQTTCVLLSLSAQHFARLLADEPAVRAEVQRVADNRLATGVSRWPGTQ